MHSRDMLELAALVAGGVAFASREVAPLSALKGISPAKAAALTEALGVDTIGELASNRFVRAAKTIAQAVAPGP